MKRKQNNMGKYDWERDRYGEPDKKHRDGDEDYYWMLKDLRSVEIKEEMEGILTDANKYCVECVWYRKHVSKLFGIKDDEWDWCWHPNNRDLIRGKEANMEIEEFRKTKCNGKWWYPQKKEKADE